MPITFDTLDELKEFYLTFSLETIKRKPVATSAKSAVAVSEPQNSPAQEPKRRGRKPGSTNKEVAAVAPQNKRSVNNVAQIDSGRKKRGVARIEKPSRREKGETLTAKIQNAIENFLSKGQSFTANDVYDVLAKKDNSINKQSVITSVLKQMNGNYKQVSVTERPGNGPRAVKLYNASK